MHAARGLTVRAVRLPRKPPASPKEQTTVQRASLLVDVPDKHVPLQPGIRGRSDEVKRAPAGSHCHPPRSSWVRVRSSLAGPLSLAQEVVSSAHVNWGLAVCPRHCPFQVRGATQ